MGQKVLINGQEGEPGAVPPHDLCCHLTVMCYYPEPNTADAASRLHGDISKTGATVQELKDRYSHSVLYYTADLSLKDCWQMVELYE